MRFGLLDGAEDGEHNDAVFVEISKIFAMQDAIFLWNGSFLAEFGDCQDLSEERRVELIISSGLSDQSLACPMCQLD